MQALWQELTDRLGESSAVLAMPRLLMTDHLQQTLSDFRRKLRDDHRRQWAVLQGINPAIPDPEEPPAKSEDDDVGISVQGDTHYHMESTTKAAPSALGKVAPWLAALALGTGGALAPSIYQWITTPAPAVSNVDSDWELGVSVTEQP